MSPLAPGLIFVNPATYPFQLLYPVQYVALSFNIVVVLIVIPVEELVLKLVTSEMVTVEK
jgi:hypothetical protein